MTLDGIDAHAARSIALQPSPHDVLRTAVAVSRDALDIDLTFAAEREGADLRVGLSSGAKDPRFHEIRIAAGRGLGGQVVDRGTPMRVDDYAEDPRITHDFVDIVSGGEGLHGIACVPVQAPDGATIGLLYAARHRVGGVGDRAVDVLAEIASFAELGLAAAAQRAVALEEQRLLHQQRLAADLHDTVAQALFAIGVAARRGARDPDADRDVLLASLAEISATVGVAREQLRRAFTQLTARAPEGELDARLAATLGRQERATGCAAQVVRRGAPAPMPAIVEGLAHDVALEGVRNAAKHQRAPAAVVVLDQRGPRLVVTVQSEAGPAPPGEACALGTGCGLELLRRRAEQLRGSLTLTVEGGAAVLRLEVPSLVAVG